MAQAKQKTSLTLSTRDLQTLSALTRGGNLTVDLTSVDLAPDWADTLEHHGRHLATEKLRVLSALIEIDPTKFFLWTSELMRENRMRATQEIIFQHMHKSDWLLVIVRAQVGEVSFIPRDVVSAAILTTQVTELYHRLLKWMQQLKPECAYEFFCSVNSKYAGFLATDASEYAESLLGKFDLTLPLFRNVRNFLAQDTCKIEWGLEKFQDFIAMQIYAYAWGGDDDDVEKCASFLEEYAGLVAKLLFLRCLECADEDDEHKLKVFLKPHKFSAIEATYTEDDGIKTRIQDLPIEATLYVTFTSKILTQNFSEMQTVDWLCGLYTLEKERELFEWMRKLPANNLLNQQIGSNYILKTVLSLCFDNCDEFVRNHNVNIAEAAGSGSQGSLVKSEQSESVGSSQGSLVKSEQLESVGSSEENAAKKQKT